MPFDPMLSLYWKNNGPNSQYMAVLILPTHLDLNRDFYSFENLLEQNRASTKYEGTAK